MVADERPFCLHLTNDFPGEIVFRIRSLSVNKKWGEKHKISKEYTLCETSLLISLHNSNNKPNSGIPQPIRHMALNRYSTLFRHLTNKARRFFLYI